MALLRFYLANEIESLARNRVRLKVIGRRDRLPDGIASAIAQAEAATAMATRSICASPSTIRRATPFSTPRRLPPGCNNLTREIFSQLVTGEAEFRDVDLIIRTSGEKRLSDFLLWESAYAEFYFTDRMWPDFAADDLADALECLSSARTPVRRLAVGDRRAGSEPRVNSVPIHAQLDSPPSPSDRWGTRRDSDCLRMQCGDCV